MIMRPMVDTQLRAVLFHGLADHSRLAILRELEHGERRVSDLVASSGLTQSNVSKHLACLWECGLVERERRGREIRYRLVAGIAELLASADAVLADTGERVRACPRYGARRPEAA
jgi:DNA-binding transcriptional ArsR family regulator